MQSMLEQPSLTISRASCLRKLYFRKHEVSEEILNYVKIQNFYVILLKLSLKFISRNFLKAQRPFFFLPGFKIMLQVLTKGSNTVKNI